MASRIALSAALVAVFGMLAVLPAGATMIGPTGTATHSASLAIPAAYKLRHRFAVRGRVHPRHGPIPYQNYGQPDVNTPLLYNAPHEFDPTGFPYNDFPRDYYPGLGLYR
jgi:hypothetical protein